MSKKKILNGGEIDKLRKELYLTHKEFASLISEKLGESVSRGAVSHWISGRRNPELKYQKVLSELWNSTFCPCRV